MEDFPSRLRRLRKQEGRSQRVLSELCGLSSDAVRRYERGEAKPSMDAMIALANHFGVTLDYLIGLTDDT